MRFFYPSVCFLTLLLATAAVVLAMLPGRREGRDTPRDQIHLLDFLETAAELSTPWNDLSRRQAAQYGLWNVNWRGIDPCPVQGFRIKVQEDTLMVAPQGKGPHDLLLRWQLPLPPGESCRMHVQVRMPVNHPGWIRAIRSGDLTSSVIPTVRHAPAAGIVESLRSGGEELGHGEPPPRATGEDCLDSMRATLEGIHGSMKLRELLEKEVGRMTSAREDILVGGERILHFKAAPAGQDTVLGLDIRDLAGPLHLSWAHERFNPEFDRLHSGLYRYARTHADTALIKRMVASGEEDRLSMVLPPVSRVGMDVVLPESAVLEFGVKALSPLLEGKAAAPSWLAVEMETEGDGVVVLHEEKLEPPGRGRSDAWSDQRIECGLPAGSSGRLRFRVDSAAGPGGAVVAVSDPILYTPQRGKEMVSILIVTVDSLRPDHVGRLVNGRSLTPNIDAFQAGGVTVSHAVTTGLNTYTALPSMVTSSALMCKGGEGFRARPVLDLPTLADVVRQNGRFVHAILPDIYMNSFFKGFPCRPRTSGSREPGVEDAERISRALKFLELRRKDPFLLWVHLDDPHTPWLPDPADAVVWGIPDVQDPGPDRPFQRLELALQCWKSPDLDPVARNHVKRYLNEAYHAEVRRADRLVGRLLDGLGTLDLERNTLVVLHADHGIEVHGENVGGRGLGDSTIRVPLIFRLPGVLPAGQVRRGVMSLLDVAPTLLGFLGLNPPLAWQGEDRSGWLLGTIPHIRPDLEAGEPLDLRDGWAVVRHLDGAMVRTLDWRWEVSLAAGGGKTGRLVAENTPLSSRVSLADRHPEVAGALDRLLRERLRTLQADFSSMPLSGTMKRFLRQAGYLTEEGGGR